MVDTPHGNTGRPVKVIDPHLHLFNLDAGSYEWLKPDMAPRWPDKQQLRRSWLESDLSLSPPVQLAGFVHIEAGFDNHRPWREIDWLEQHCRLPFRSIGYVELASPQFAATLARLQCYASVAGIRNILDESAAEVLNSSRVREHLVQLADVGLMLELQLDFTDRAAVEQVCRLAERIPHLTWVFNHGGLALEVTEAWQASITQLAELPGVYVKCSGWEMRQRNWQLPQVMPLLDMLLQRFGEQRLMLASNFPVSELALSYDHLWQDYARLCKAQLPAALLYDNARRLYGFSGL